MHAKSPRLETYWCWSSPESSSSLDSVLFHLHDSRVCMDNGVIEDAIHPVQTKLLRSEVEDVHALLVLLLVVIIILHSDRLNHHNLVAGGDDSQLQDPMMVIDQVVVVARISDLDGDVALLVDLGLLGILKVEQVAGTEGLVREHGGAGFVLLIMTVSGTAVLGVMSSFVLLVVSNLLLSLLLLLAVGAMVMAVATVTIAVVHQCAAAIVVNNALVGISVLSLGNVVARLELLVADSPGELLIAAHLPLAVEILGRMLSMSKQPDILVERQPSALLLLFLFLSLPDIVVLILLPRLLGVIIMDDAEFLLKVLVGEVLERQDLNLTLGIVLGDVEIGSSDEDLLILAPS